MPGKPRPAAARARRPCLAGAAAGVVLTLAACTGGAEDGAEEELTILAASSLTEVFTELAAEFEADHPGVEVTIALGSSTDLAEQAADGAPGDVLATADPRAMTIATDAGVAADPRPFAANTMVLVVPPGNPAQVESVDDLAGTAWVRCADQVPCGRLAVQVLRDAGVVADPVSLEEDVKTALEKVTAGEADAALVYATDAVAAGDAVRAVEVDSDASTTYLIASLEQAASPALARDWVELLGSERGRTAFSDAGFS